MQQKITQEELRKMAHVVDTHKACEQWQVYDLQPATEELYEECIQDNRYHGPLLVLDEAEKQVVKRVKLPPVTAIVWLVYPEYGHIKLSNRTLEWGNEISPIWLVCGTEAYMVSEDQQYSTLYLEEQISLA
jgi:hypothetical protein